MTAKLVTYYIQAPSFYVGEVIGYLSGVGGSIERINEESGRLTVLARLPLDAFERVEQWLLQATGGKAHIYAATSVNDDDA